MQDALRAKKARGLDLTILIGGQQPLGGAEPMEGTPEEEKKDQEEAGLAPEGSPVDKLSDDNAPMKSPIPPGPGAVSSKDDMKMPGQMPAENSLIGQPPQDAMTQELAKAGLGKMGKMSKANPKMMGK